MDKPVLAFLLSATGVAISTADILYAFQIFALAVPTAYALWKWRQDYLNNKKDNPNV